MLSLAKTVAKTEYNKSKPLHIELNYYIHMFL